MGKGEALPRLQHASFPRTAHALSNFMTHAGQLAARVHFTTNEVEGCPIKGLSTAGLRPGNANNSKQLTRLSFPVHQN